MSLDAARRNGEGPGPPNETMGGVFLEASFERPLFQVHLLLAQWYAEGTMPQNFAEGCFEGHCLEHLQYATP